MVLTSFSLLMPAFSLPTAPTSLARTPSPLWGRSPTTCPEGQVPGFGGLLQAPFHFPRSRVRPVSCYALFQGWLLLSQPPGCLNTTTSFPTQQSLQDLNRGSGLFPSRPRNSSPGVRLPCYPCPAFVVWLGSVTKKAPSPSSALPPAPIA